LPLAKKLPLKLKQKKNPARQDRQQHETKMTMQTPKCFDSFTSSTGRLAAFSLLFSSLPAIELSWSAKQISIKEEKKHKKKSFALEMRRNVSSVVQKSLKSVFT
jgi:hypothetical protein